ncbi:MULTISPECIES: FecR family protein [Butyricimonas]|uniref:FecR family protein n=1 Tax=Butyricimonas TaxID=574697 RepID=UPI001D07B9C9|nr:MULTISPECIES: FecR family protein [Butyricimonas]MCB6974844.1 FecR domain-containing protein [Butyricimonas synergistica]MCG4521586.1 FecR domain-containing protein [Butyricimonas sp. DFI.6.44]
MEDEILKIIAAELAGENVSGEEKESVKRWREESRGNERMYRMMVEELGEVVGLVRMKGGLDREKAYERLEGEMQKKMIRQKENGKVRRMSWWRYGASVAGVLLMLGVGMAIWMKPEENKVRLEEKRVVPGSGQVVLTLGGGEVVLLKRDTSELILADTTLRVTNERNTLVYSEIENKRMSEGMVYNTLTVPANGEYQLVLADGTKVFLNSGSEIRYPEVFGKDRREVFLRGEAWFEVAKDSGREFLVHAGAMEVKVLGTSFNVKAYEKLKTVATTLVEGSVEIACDGESFRIVPGEQFVYDKNSREANVMMVDTELYTSWKDGYYKFRQATLEEIMTTLSLWYGLNVFYQNESAKHVEFTGKVKRYEDIRTLLDKFEQTENVVFDIKENNVFIKIK